eukprot:CAMPEP_0117650374 /NCGR_PEP_ID=MMETSP0804-20121206/1505_1 /TAXON_ID=1074897 /ORGANISM="Tetraselmis astigmatica, Strain CCMP880" /LENGTH=84 /DNA_ID=CAMNT_0005456241 /DNA_START=15 /DNA_END=269 /DNA_ORIENTATION=+
MSEGELEPPFSPNVFQYVLKLHKPGGHADIVAMAKAPGASVSINGNPLPVGTAIMEGVPLEERLTVSVVSQDSRERASYVVVVE